MKDYHLTVGAGAACGESYVQSHIDLHFLTSFLHIVGESDMLA